MSPQKHALFAGLVVDDSGQAVEAVYIGDEPFYVVLDNGFRRHVEARFVDRQVLEQLRQQIMAHRELVTEGTLAMLGRDDLFTKAMVDASIERMDEHMEALLLQGLPEHVRLWLGMLGFRVVINVHGELVRLEFPGQDDLGYE